MAPLFLLSCLLLGYVADARVTFHHSEVLQLDDIPDKGTRAPFKCPVGCRAYTDSKSGYLWISRFNPKTKVYELVVNFGNMGGTNRDEPEPYILPANNNYFIENRGEFNSFVFYAVSNDAPNMKPGYSRVLVLHNETGLNFEADGDEFITILSSQTSAITYSKYGGGFLMSPYGRPRIYATGFDAIVGANSIQEEECKPIYEARSLDSVYDSNITVWSPISTTDGFSRYYYNVKWNYRTFVYTSPGYVGCTYNSDQSYFSHQTAVDEMFKIDDVPSLYVRAYLNLPTDNDALNLVINNEVQSIYGKPEHRQFFNNTTSFSVGVKCIKWKPYANFALQMDFLDLGEDFPHN